MIFFIIFIYGCFENYKNLESLKDIFFVSITNNFNGYKIF